MSRSREVAKRIVEKVEVARLSDTAYLGVENLVDEIEKSLRDLANNFRVYTDRIIPEYKEYLEKDSSIEIESKVIRYRTISELQRFIDLHTALKEGEGK